MPSGYLRFEDSQDINIPVRINHAMTVGAISMVLAYPSDIIDILNVTAKNEGDGRVIFSTADGELRIAWYKSEGLAFADDETLLTIRVRLKDEDKAAAIQFEPLSGSEIADEEANVDHVSLTIPRLLPVHESSSVHVYPNPFSDKTSFDIYLKEDSRIELHIYDILGHEVMEYSTEEFVSTGNHKIEFNGQALSQGIYQYKLLLKGQNIEILRTGRLILQK
jgi:hypothetical protein